MLRRINLILGISLLGSVLHAQKPSIQIGPKPNPAQAVTPPPVAPKPLSFKKLASGIEYGFIIDKPGSNKPKEGDMIKVNMQSVCNNRLLYSSSQANKGKPAEFGVNKPNFKGDLIEVIMLMTPGDSIACQVDADLLYSNTKNKKPDFIKKGDKIQYFIKLISIKPKEQVEKEQQAAFNKQIKEQMEKQQKEAAKQMAKEDKELTAYFTAHQLQPQKTASGMYYIIRQPGQGNQPAIGDSVVMNYTGTLLDGTKFDSNEDTAFHHVTPFQFALGKGMVIKGWDEGIALLQPGAKATFYIPSPLAYGAQARPGGGANPKGIPANSILLFDVELASVKPAAAAPAPTAAPSTPPVQNQNK